MALFLTVVTRGQVAGTGGDKDLVVAANGKTQAVIVVAADAGPEAKRAAADLATYIGLMTGATPTVAATPEAAKAAVAGTAPVLLIGQAALDAEPSLAKVLAAAIDKPARLRRDAIALRRAGNRVYIAGNNDYSHYYAAAELLRLWGCRWYMPTEFGECIPEHAELRVGTLDYAYSSPFEVRSYWISWVGDGTGADDFRRRNMMTDRAGFPQTGHAIGKYVQGLGKNVFNIPLTDPKTADHVADAVDGMFAAGQDFSLGMEDGSYDSDYPKDQELMKMQWDKYFMRWSVSDPFLELYNNVATRLEARHPESTSKIGFLAYGNMTIPPVRDMKAHERLYCELAPIDFDPIHGIGDIQSPPRREYGEALAKWAKVMDGRLSIYDYDQSMLVWRDLPNPSHMAFAVDVKHYRDAGIMGVNTESRNAIGTTFTNLYMRGRLMWEPDASTDELLADFYTRFYGPAAAPMALYWNAIYAAWSDTIVTEHEYFIAPAIYTPELLATMGEQLAAAEQAVAPIKAKAEAARSRNERLYLDRMTFTRMSYEITSNYLGMVHAAAREVDYATAVQLGEKALAVRETMTDMNGTFTTYRGMNVENGGYAWFPGEVKQYRELLAFTNGDNGTLLMTLPMDWQFHRDPENKGVELGYAKAPVDLTYWEANKDALTLDNRKDYPVDQWEVLRADLYMQAQGIRHPDRQSYVGHAWYRSDITVPAGAEAGAVHLRFPGLFNEAWLYVNGVEVAHREQGNLWWLNDYRFEWDVDLAGKLKPGTNVIALRVNCEHHMGGMFRRPFLYTAK